LYITQSNVFISTTLYFWLYLPNAEMNLDLEVNEVEVKVLTSLALVTGITGGWSVKNRSPFPIAHKHQLWPRLVNKLASTTVDKPARLRWPA
jgi:hypothetical protein